MFRVDFNSNCNGEKVLKNVGVVRYLDVAWPLVLLCGGFGVGSWQGTPISSMNKWGTRELTAFGVYGDICYKE